VTDPVLLIIDALPVHEPTGWLVDADAGIVYGGGRSHRGKRIGYLMSAGYWSSKDAQRRDWLLHRVIWETANGPIPHKLEINHLNGIKTDNHLANLELVTSSENTQHAYRTGLIDREKHRRNTLRGEAHGQAKITQGIADSIRSDLDGGLSQRAAARRHGISQKTVWAIAAGQRWTR